MRKSLAGGGGAGVEREREGGPSRPTTRKPAGGRGRVEKGRGFPRLAEEAPAVADTSPPSRAADVLARRLPSIPKPEENDANKATAATSGATPGATGGMKKQMSPATPKTAGVPHADQQPKVGVLAPRRGAAPAPAQASGSADAPKPAEPHPPTTPPRPHPPANDPAQPPHVLPPPPRPSRRDL